MADAEAGARASAALAAAMSAHQAGRLDDAERGYREALVLDADLADGHAYLGLLLHQSGRGDAGVASLHRAIAIAPGDAFHHANLGVVLIERGDRDAALAAWREVVRIDPADADGHFHIGVLLGDLGKHADAARALGSAAELAPGDAGIHAALSSALRGAGRGAEALEAARRARALAPRDAAAARQEAASLATLGRRAEAESAYRGALSLDPAHAATWHNLGVLLLDGEGAAEALAAFERAAALVAPNAPAELGAARALDSLVRPGEALGRCRAALACAPDDAFRETARAAMASILCRLDAGADAHRLAEDLVGCLSSAAVDAQLLAAACARAIRARLGPLALSAADPQHAKALESTLESDPLWLAFLQGAVNVDPTLERVIAALRRRQLEDVGESSSPARLAHAAALATQAFAGEYVIDVSAPERADADALLAGLGRTSAGTDPCALELAVLVASGYRSPETLPGAILDALLAPGRSAAPTRAFLERAVVEPRVERALAVALPALTEVTDATSRAVREQYEENPYPRWRTLAAGPPTSIVEVLRRRAPGHTPAPVLDGTPAVLVAGCGTGREALDIAASCPGTEVTAVDLSRRSLAYGARMAEALGIPGVTFMHGDILDLARLDRRFPVIVSTGVLHHMDDPMAGWRVLAGMLAPGGVMRIGLYSRRARADVTAARAAIVARGIASDAASIARFRAELLELPDGDPLASLRTSDDLYTTSACRDLLFHVCERTFDPAGIAAALDTLGLDFLGFEIPDAATLRAFRAEHPGPGAERDLGAWEAFEQAHPDAFVGMYQFWCVRPAGEER